MTTATPTAPTVSSAQVGNGRTPHYIRTDTFHAHTLCRRRATRVLTEREAAKASRHCASCTRALQEITRTAQPAPAQEEPAPTPATPGDVTRPGVTIRKSDRMKWTVERDGQMGVIFDEEGMKRGRWAAWSPFALTRHGMATFTDNPEEAVDAILATLPVHVSTLAKTTGHAAADILAEAGDLAVEWAEQGPRAVLRTEVVADEAQLSGPAALVILEALAARAAETPPEGPGGEAAPAPGEPEWRTLKGVTAPCFLYGEELDHGWRPAGDRKQVTGQPLRIVRLWMRGGLRYAEDVNGREVYLYGPAAKFWTAPVR